MLTKSSHCVPLPEPGPPEIDHLELVLLGLVQLVEAVGRDAGQGAARRELEGHLLAVVCGGCFLVHERRFVQFLLQRLTSCVEICLCELFRSSVTRSDSVLLPRSQKRDGLSDDFFLGKRRRGLS